MSYLAQYNSIPPDDVATRTSLISGWLRTDTRPFFAELRRSQPVFQTPAFTLVTRYNDVIDVLRRNADFSVKIYGDKMDRVVGPHMLGRDHSLQNTRDKPFMRVAMPDADAERVRGMVRRWLEDLLPDESDDFDVVREVSRLIPVKLCAEYFGFPGPDVATMMRWSKATQTDFFKNIQRDTRIHEAAVSAGRAMKSYLKELISEREQAIRTDSGAVEQTVVDHLVQLYIDGHLPLEPEALIANIAGLLIGAVETTSQAIAQTLQQILLREDVHELALTAIRAEANDDLLDITNEALRFNPINPLLFRYTETDTVLAAGTPHAHPVRRGATIFACTASAMWDGEVIQFPDQFSTNRSRHHYLHFGVNSHECLGRTLGETMIVEVVSALLQRGARPIDGTEGAIQFNGGPFPESYRIELTGQA